MSDKEQVAQKQVKDVKEKQAETGSASPETILKDSANKITKYGGFDLLEMTIDGFSNLNPERKARKKIFLTDAEKKKERQDLKVTLNLWMEMLNSSATIPEMIEKAEKKSESTVQLLNSNLKKAVETTKELEVAYRSVHLFYKNTEQDKIKNISIMNASPEQLKDLDNPRFIEKAAGELKHCYDRLDLRNHYSMLVVPGWLGSKKVVDRWAKLAHENKVTLITDFEHFDKPDDVMDMFESANLTGGDKYLSNALMTCNWLVGRGKYEELGEEEDLFVPPSAAMAGKVYGTLMSQVAAGKKYGKLNEVDGAAFELKKSELSELEKMGLVPMIQEYGQVQAFSAKTLFNGDDLGLQTYSVVRVFDYIMKVLMDFLNRRAFENWNANLEKDLRGQIVRFLDKIAGPGKLIEKFSVLNFSRDPETKNVMLDIHMTPYFPAKTFMIKLNGTKGDDAADWLAEYSQK